MNWASVFLIFRREWRDQLRDRRTLFTVVVLPLLLYPLMGMALLQLAQFMREHPTRIWLVGSEQLPNSPSLLQGNQIAPEWCGAERPELLELVFSDEADREFQQVVSDLRNRDSENQSGQENIANFLNAMVQEEMRKRDIHLTLLVPPNFETNGSAEAAANLYLFTNSASDKSNIAFQRVSKILGTWKKGVVAEQLRGQSLPLSLVEPFQVATADVARSDDKQAAIWSKILPFVVMIWALTGAFYPAVDLCAGEKERGTFETLLSSPARRSEIAIGKLMTVILFSFITSVLNLVSMGVTGLFVASRVGNAGGLSAVLGVPPLTSLLWLLVALVPITALFSGMALAAAAFARSSKEGQYYLIPLMMISMPLMMLPMLPAAKLDFGSSLIPISGLMLLLRGLMEGNYQDVLPFVSPVAIVTFACCWLAVRWVVRQFESETVLFRASERFGLGAWVKQVMAQRNELPSVGNAFLCAMLILVLKFFISFGLTVPAGWWHFAKQTLIVLVATVAMPAILMGLFLTTNPRKSFRFNLCRPSYAAAAVLMALFLHPLIMGFTTFVMYIYPPSGDLAAMDAVVKNILGDAPGLWAVLLVFALAPAMMEELAFRGFILSGFQNVLGKRSQWGAILISSLFFGLAHSILQQSIITFGVGMILGVIAVRTGSLIPCILYHAVHNGVTVLFSYVNQDVVAHSSLLQWALARTDSGVYQYSLPVAILMICNGLLLLVWLIKFQPKERLERSSGFCLAPAKAGSL